MRPKQIIILLLLLLFACPINAQVSEYDYKAAFIERFTRFIEWPEEFEDDTFRVGVFGKNPFNSSLDELFNDIKIKNQNVKLIYTKDLEDLSKANLVFISGSEKKRLTEILSVITKEPILIISDQKGFCEMGVYINMFLDDNYIRYEINQDAIEKSGLKVSSLLMGSAKIIKASD